MVASPDGREGRRPGGGRAEAGRADDLARRRRAVGRTPVAAGGGQASQEAGPPAPRRPSALRRADPERAQRRAVAAPAACARLTANDRLPGWVAHGCSARAWARPLAAYGGEVGLDRRWQAAGGCIVKAPPGKKGGGTRRHPLTDGRGEPHRQGGAGRPARRRGLPGPQRRGRAPPLPRPGLRLRGGPRGRRRPATRRGTRRGAGSWRSAPVRSRPSRPDRRALWRSAGAFLGRQTCPPDRAPRSAGSTRDDRIVL